MAYIDSSDKTPAGANAKTLLKSIEELEFQFVFRVLNDAFERTGFLSDSLQSSELEMDRCQRLIETTLLSLKEIRDNHNFEKLYDQSIEFAKENEIQMTSLPRQRRVPKQFQGSLPELSQFSSVEEKYRTIYYLILDSVIDNIKSRFQPNVIEPLILIEKTIKRTSKKEDLNA